MGEELRLTQSRCNTLQASLDKTEQDSISLTGERMGKQIPLCLSMWPIFPTLEKMGTSR